MWLSSAIMESIINIEWEILLALRPIENIKFSNKPIKRCTLAKDSKPRFDYYVSMPRANGMYELEIVLNGGIIAQSIISKNSTMRSGKQTSQTIIFMRCLLTELIEHSMLPRYR